MWDTMDDKIYLGKLRGTYVVGLPVARSTPACLGDVDLRESSVLESRGGF